MTALAAYAAQQHPELDAETVAALSEKIALELLARIDDECHKLYQSGRFREWLVARRISSTIFLEGLKKE